MTPFRTIILFFGFLWFQQNTSTANNLITSNDSAIAMHYNINLNITNIAAKQLSGFTDITMTPKWNGLHRVVLDFFKLTTDSVYFNQTLVNYSHNDTLLEVFLPNSLNIGDTFTLRVYYHGTPKVEAYGWGGFHFSGNSSAYNLGIALQDIPHNYGRIWFPCLDNFKSKSTYQFNIRVNNPLVAVCNGILTDVTDHGDGTSTYSWVLNYPVNAYLASVAVGNYVPVTGVYHGILGDIPTYIYVKPQDTTKARNSFIHLNQVLSTFESRFGPYRWPRVGYVSTTLGAMEHATNIAYPSASIDGTLSDEYLYAHELSHMWFGDLVTCSSDFDMWLNEGLATFCESIFKEGVYGREAYKNNMRQKLHNVLQSTHIKDNGYRALSPLPENYTYGSTSYDKGGIVAHSLRGYLGDSLFFTGLTSLLNHKAWSSVSSIEVRDYLDSVTHVSLNDFFATWIFEPGFPHFSIDSVKILPTSTGSDVTVYLRQRLKGATVLYNHNHLELGFLGASWEYLKDTIIFSGAFGEKTFHVPFQPVQVMVDPDEKMADATTDMGMVISTTGTKTLSDTYCTLSVDHVVDSAFVRVTHNWVRPDTFPQPIPGLRLSNYRYWSVEGLFPPGFSTKARFYYSKFNNLDNGIITSQQDSVIILYRPSTKYMWQSVPFTQSGSAYQGELVVDTLRKGEYTIAVWNQTSGINDQNQESGRLRVFPNPGRENLSIATRVQKPSLLKVFNISGVQLDSIEIKPGFQIQTWNPGNLQSGSFIFKLLDNSGKIIATQKGMLVH